LEIHVVQLLRIIDISAELYLSYDCDLYLPNLFEELTEILFKNASLAAGFISTHILNLVHFFRSLIVLNLNVNFNFKNKEKWL
jgi:hypothetical protein